MSTKKKSEKIPQSIIEVIDIENAMQTGYISCAETKEIFDPAEILNKNQGIYDIHSCFLKNDKLYHKNSKVEQKDRPYSFKRPDYLDERSVEEMVNSGDLEFPTSFCLAKKKNN